MNIDDNELVSAKTFSQMNELEKQKFTPIPPELQSAAERKLNGRGSVSVSKHSGGKLSRWAAVERKKKRKAQKKARRANR